MNDKKDITITNVFQKILKQSKSKPYKIWVSKGSKFCNRSMKSWLEKTATEMYSRHNEGKSIVAEKYIRTLKNKMYKYITSISKNVYIDQLDDIVYTYNNTYHNPIKMKSADVKPKTYINSSKEINEDQDPKFKIDSIFRIGKYKTIFEKGYVPNWSQKVFVIEKVKNTAPWTYIISGLKGELVV